MPSLQTADGRTLSWEERGSGEPLLLHPGGPGFSAAPFAEQPELAAERTLLVLDQRGTGRSDRPGDAQAYDLEDYANDIEALREHLGVERLDLIGHSFGGFVAINWAGNHPERVGDLILAGAVPRFIDAIRDERVERAMGHRDEPYFEEAMTALRLQMEGKYSTDDELAQLYKTASPLFAPHGVDAGEVFDALRRAGTNTDAVRHFNEQVAPTMDQRQLLRRIEAPALLITGALDPFRHTMEEMEAELPNASTILLPGADHFLLLESAHRPAWSRAILAFLAT